MPFAVSFVALSASPSAPSKAQLIADTGTRRHNRAAPDQRCTKTLGGGLKSI